MGDREYRNTRRSGRRARQVDEEDDYEAGPRWAPSPQYLPTAQHYAEPQSGQYLTAQPRDAGYLDPRSYQNVQGGRVAQDTADDPSYWPGPPPTNPYQNQPPTSYGQNQPYPAPQERRGESSRRRQSRHSGELTDTGQGAALRPVSEDENEIDIYLKSKSETWESSRGFHDTGNRASHLVGSRKVLSLGFDKSHMDFDDVQKFRTFGGAHHTLGSIKLDYTLSDGTVKKSRFQVFDSNNIPEFDVILSPNRRDELSLDSPEPIVLMTLLAKKTADRAVIRAQKNIFIQREAEAAAEAEEERRTMARQGARRTRPPNRPSGPSYGGSSSRNPRPQAEDREYQDWVQQQHSQSSAQVQPEADPTRNSSPYSAHPGYYADGSSTQSRIQEADTTQTSIYSNPQDAYSYQQNPPDSPELAFDQQSGSYYRVPPPRSSRHQKIEEEPRYTSHGVYAQGYPQGQDARDPYAQNQYAQGYPAAQDPRGQPNPPYGYDDHYDTSRTGRGRR